MRTWRIVLFAVFMNSMLSASQVQTITDRLILRINESSYTQREIEAHMIVRALEENNNELLVTEKNWTKSLELFERDMLIFEDSYRIKEANVSDENDLKKVWEGIRSKAILATRADAIALTTLDLQEVLPRYRKMSAHSDVIGSLLDKKSRLTKNTKNLESLRFNNHVRFYDDASTYKLIDPAPFLNSLKDKP